MSRRRKTRSALVLAVLFAAVLVVSWMISVMTDLFGLGGGREIMVNIPKGTGVKGITDILREQGVIKHKLIFRLSERMGGDHLFQQGGHLLKSGMSYREIIEKLTAAPDVGVDEIVKVLIPEGYELRQIADALEEKGLISRDEFMREIEKGDFDYEFVREIPKRENRLEGYLFPATYEIRVGETEHEIIERMLKKFGETAVPLYNKYSSDFSLDEIITLASMIEREAANDGERKRVSAVFYNRLKKDMTLSSCATVQYIIKERKPILSNSDIKIKSDYNTYINKGLPIGPIAVPGERSIEAALCPEDSDYLYFAAKTDGNGNVFSKTGEEHMRIVNEIQGN